ncbi:MAG: DUF2807 domain-containing protein [Burkholderiaceae bacterium]|nr:DUF2807 domain-containing protein [Burkholderiaceae bacterium]
MKVLMRVGAGMLMLAVALIGVSFGVLRAEGVGEYDIGDYNNGKHALASETRKVDAGVSTIDLDGPVDLVLKQGSTPSLVVRAEQNMLARVKTVQNGSSLRIDAEGHVFHFNRPMRVELTLPSLQQLSMHGSGDSRVSGFSGDKLTLALHGSGDIRFDGQYQHVNAGLFGSGDLDLKLLNAGDVALDLQGSGDISTSGQSKSLTARVTGSGDLDAEKLLADAVKIDVLGSGDSSVYAKQSIAVDLTGSGDIDVHGNPAQRQINKLGSGDISWEN